MLCCLSAEPRPDCQLRHRGALSRTDEPRPLSRDDRVSVADARHSDAVPRAGIRRVDPVLLFCRSRERTIADVREGRRGFLAQFPSLATGRMQDKLPDPDDTATFRRSVLDLSERRRHASIYALHRDLLALRRTDPVLARPAGSTARSLRTKLGCCGFSRRAMATVY